ncbi:hypothetical protein C4573_01860 [Candidatus Woesearchaeota archaeon]|nr:MAG: hypothetical protein C4573_01860 [Candidatus Woesearchaeota archaeon]
MIEDIVFPWQHFSERIRTRAQALVEDYKKEHGIQGYFRPSLVHPSEMPKRDLFPVQKSNIRFCDAHSHCSVSAPVYSPAHKRLYYPLDATLYSMRFTVETFSLDKKLLEEEIRRLARLTLEDRSGAEEQLQRFYSFLYTSRGTNFFVYFTVCENHLDYVTAERGNSALLQYMKRDDTLSDCYRHLKHMVQIAPVITVQKFFPELGVLEKFAQ